MSIFLSLFLRNCSLLQFLQKFIFRHRLHKQVAKGKPERKCRKYLKRQKQAFHQRRHHKSHTDGGDHKCIGRVLPSVFQVEFQGKSHGKDRDDRIEKHTDRTICITKLQPVVVGVRLLLSIDHKGDILVSFIIDLPQIPLIDIDPATCQRIQPLCILQHIEKAFDHI